MKVTVFDLEVIISKHGEIEFQISGDSEYSSCFMGNMGRFGLNRAEMPYWLGLTPDGKQGYEYKTYDEMLNAPVFHGQSLKSIIDKVEIISIDACAPESMYSSNHT